MTPEELIVYIARVSNPENQNNKETSTKLIQYLIKHKHWSPFDMVDMTVEVVTSRAIAQQMIRHKSFCVQEFCISGDSLITLRTPKGNVYKRPIANLYKLQTQPNQYIKRNGLPLARVYDGEKFITSRIKEVFKTGVKPVFKITLSEGKTITCTKEHKFLSAEGYISLEDIVGLTMVNTKAVMTKVGVIATNGVPVHQNYDWLKLQKETSILNKTGVNGIAEAAEVSYHTIRKWLKKLNLQFTKMEVAQTYDIWNKGKFGYVRKPHSLETIEKMRKSAKKGAANNLYKGGVDRSERIKICDWANTIRAEKLIESDYACVLCKSKKKLELDHILPVYSHPELAYSKENIRVLCNECHSDKHTLTGDRKIWRAKSKGNTLTVKWDTITKVEYVGEVDTYDLEVFHETHNYVANGIVVHNSQRYSLVTAVEPTELRAKASTNRQSSSEVIDNPILKSRVLDHIEGSLKLYDLLIEEGVAKECARGILPLNTQTTLYFKGSIRSWIHYLEIRCAENTQLEHRQVALECQKIFKENFPNIYQAVFNNESA